MWRSSPDKEEVSALTHTKNLGKAKRTLDKLKRKDPRKYRRKEVGLNKYLRKHNLI
jgi:hypothetical protein